MNAIGHRSVRAAAGLVSLGALVVGGGIASAGPTPIGGFRPIRRPSALDKSAAIPPPPAYEIAAPTISSSYDPATCKIHWETTVRNISSDSTAPLTIQAYGTKANAEVGPAGGTSIPSIAKGQSQTGGMTVDPFAYKTGAFPTPTHLVIALFQNSSRVVTSAPAPLPPIPSFATTVTVQPHRVTDLWGITLKNQGTQGYPGIGIIVQASASNSTTGPWEASGGLGAPDCLPPQKDMIVTGTRLAGRRYVKIEIALPTWTLDHKMESRTVLWERVLDSATVLDKSAVVEPTLRK
jgi:hypothetical protein